MRRGHLPRRQRLATRGGTLEYVLSGRPGPRFVLVNGAGVTLDGWRTLYPAIEQLGTVFAWNRLGLGASDAPHRPPTGAAVVASLRELLAYAGVAPPYVLVGHSMGGLYAQLHARLHPQEVAAVALIEATHPQDRPAAHAHSGRLAATLARLLSVPAGWLQRNLRAEAALLEETAAQVTAAGPFPPVPLRVVSGQRSPPGWLVPPEALLVRQAHQRELAALSPRGRQVAAARSGHFPQLTEPQLVLDVLRELAGEAAAVAGAFSPAAVAR